MSNLTITVDSQTLKKARLRAIEQGTSVNSVLRDFLEAYAGLRSERTKALQELIALSRNSDSRRGGRVWCRNDLHQRD
ncbi:hypothetical protein [Desulfoferrobacter suflitae]|uniref:hypothetical protein n=1 Tax=Desulfoferrobacter suflitae TaxID=2865782 RepID=UPI0021644EA1|nr:hypothetical protein [Desulfoferrobacter suflitae]MCK8603291.1 hypothetical protein [Desulfoferrobacter suflitae]